MLLHFMRDANQAVARLGFENQILSLLFHHLDIQVVFSLMSIAFINSITSGSFHHRKQKEHRGLLRRVRRESPPAHVPLFKFTSTTSTLGLCPQSPHQLGPNCTEGKKSFLLPYSIQTS